MNKQLLSVTQWRVVLVVLSLCILTCQIWGTTYWRRFADPEVAGTMGVKYGAMDAEFRRPVLEMTADSPFARAGAKVGDKIGYDHLSDTNRLFGMEEVFGATIYSGARATHVSVKPIRSVDRVQSPTFFMLLLITQWGIAYLALFIGILVGWRRAESSAMRGFALSLMSWGGMVCIGFLPAGAAALFAFQIGGTLCVMINIGCFAYFSLAFPEERPLLHRPWIARFFYCFAAAFFIVAAGDIAYRLGMLPGGAWRASLNKVAIQGFGGSLFVCATAALLYSWRTTEGTVRQRVAWVAACMGMIYASLLFGLINILLGAPISGYVMNIVQPTIIFLSMIGLAYALLRHRVFDFGFAVNRALVFTIFSALLLIVFSISEWAVDKLLHFHGRETNAILDAFIALLVILSFHRIQHWVRHRVDHTFYHQWYAAAAKLRRFLEKAPNITTLAALEQKFAAAIEEFSGASGVAIYVIDDQQQYRLRQSTLPGAPASIDRDDDTMIEMRHSHKTVELPARGAQLPGELALPMMVRGHVNGLVLLGARTGGASFRPDQVALMGTAVHQLGQDLESLRVEQLQRRNVELEESARLNELARGNAELRAENLGMKLHQALLQKV